MMTKIFILSICNKKTGDWGDVGGYPSLSEARRIGEELVRKYPERFSEWSVYGVLWCPDTNRI